MCPVITAKIAIFADMISLSVLIPVYNWDCSSLLTELHSQGLRLGLPFEIIVADDCSDCEYGNSTTAGSLEHCRYIRLGQNLGRSAIRNYLANESRYEKLLFIDCDMQVRTDTFLYSYIQASREAKVVCGGICTPLLMPHGCELRYTYESSADRRRSARIRSRQPYQRFTTASFLIDRKEFMRIRFNESIDGYGYEDVCFGHELETRGTEILHIDNPLVHMGLDENAVFLDKTLQAIRNAYIHAPGLGHSSRIVSCYRKVCKLHATWVFRLIWRWGRKSMEKNLLGKKPNLRVFALYKLCYLCSEY